MTDSQIICRRLELEALQLFYERCVLGPLMQRLIAIYTGTGFADSDGGECD